MEYLDHASSVNKARNEAINNGSKNNSVESSSWDNIGQERTGWR